MAYEPLNFENFKTVLTAEQLNHIQNGIANVLPQNPGAYQYPATDGDGNMVWADRLAYAYRQKSYVDFEMNGQVTDEPTVYSFTGTEAQFYDSFAFDGEKGTNYEVVFDGNTFTCTCQRYVGEMDSSYWTWVIGNPALITRSVPSAIWDESDEPFVFYGYAQGGSPVFFIETTEDSEHTIQVSFASAEETVKTIDPKFLPYNIFVIKLNDNYSGVDKTWDEIVSAYNSGASIVLQSGVTPDSEFFQPPMLMPLANMNTDSTDGEATFCGMFYDGTNFRACQYAVRAGGSVGGSAQNITTTEIT